MKTERLEREINQLLTTICPSVVLTETPDSEYSTHVIEPRDGDGDINLAILSLQWFKEFLQQCIEHFDGIYSLGGAWSDYFANRTVQSHSKARAKRTPAPNPLPVNANLPKEVERLTKASVSTVAHYHGLILFPCEFDLTIPTGEITDEGPTIFTDKQTGETIEGYPLHPRRKVILKTGLTNEELFTELLAEMPHPTEVHETMEDHVVKVSITPVRYNVGDSGWIEVLSNKTPDEIWQWMIINGYVHQYLVDAKS